MAPVANKKLDERTKVTQNRIQQFQEIFGKDYPEADLIALAASDAHFSKVKWMADHGCPLDYIIKILT